jgi:hypothetical protein
LSKNIKFINKTIHTNKKELRKTQHLWGSMKMANIIKYDKKIVVPTFVAITDVSAFTFVAIRGVSGYIETRTEADALAKEHNGVIADMPRLIVELSNAEVRKAIRERWADVNSAEYQGQTKDGRIYAVGHSLGPLSTTKGIVQRIPKIQEYGFLPTTPAEWKSFMQNPEMVHIDDIKKGFSTNKPYGIFARLDKDNLTINDSARLGREAFMTDDRVLMITGSLEGRENIANILYEEGKRNTVESHHRIKEYKFDNSGRPVCLSFIFNCFFGHDGVDGNSGHFVVVAPEAQSARGNNSYSDFLEAKIKKDFDARETIILNDGLYTFIKNAKLQ